MLLSLAAIVVGLALLVWSADQFVDGSTVIAKELGVSSLIIGITIVGFGTSAPEILVSVIAVLEGTPNLAIGNALGSNIANIGLILGVTATLAVVPIDRNILKREYPLLLIATLVMVWALYDLETRFCRWHYVAVIINHHALVHDRHSSQEWYSYTRNRR